MHRTEGVGSWPELASWQAAQRREEVQLGRAAAEWRQAAAALEARAPPLLGKRGCAQGHADLSRPGPVRLEAHACKRAERVASSPHHAHDRHLAPHLELLVKRKLPDAPNPLDGHLLVGGRACGGCRPKRAQRALGFWPLFRHENVCKCARRKGPAMLGPLVHQPRIAAFDAQARVHAVVDLEVAADDSLERQKKPPGLVRRRRAGARVQGSDGHWPSPWASAAGDSERARRGKWLSSLGDSLAQNRVAELVVVNGLANSAYMGRGTTARLWHGQSLARTDLFVFLFVFFCLGAAPARRDGGCTK